MSKLENAMISFEELLIILKMKEYQFRNFSWNIRKQEGNLGETWKLGYSKLANQVGTVVCTYSLPLVLATREA